jgi:hypothetical protein
MREAPTTTDAAIDTMAHALVAGLRDLAARVVALQQALRAGRAAFAAARPRTLADLAEQHGELSARVSACEQVVAQRRAALCAALAVPIDARLRRLLPALLPATARSLAAAAGELRQALHALRLEGTVGQRLLDVTRQAQEGLVRTLAARQGARRYDRNARSVPPPQGGEFVRGTV